MIKHDRRCMHEIEYRFGHGKSSIQGDKEEVAEAEDSFHQQTGLKFMKEMLHLEHKFVRC